MIITHFLVVRDQDTSREWYHDVLGAEVVYKRDPVILKFHNGWLILNVGGGPTDDKPEVTLEPPSNPSRTNAFLNLRVADIQRVYAEWSARGAEVLTPQIDWGAEIRCYIRDPDGHLIEVGQATGILDGFEEGGRSRSVGAPLREPARATLRMATFASILQVIEITNTNSAVHGHYHNAAGVYGGRGASGKWKSPVKRGFWELPDLNSKQDLTDPVSGSRGSKLFRVVQR